MPRIPRNYRVHHREWCSSWRGARVVLLSLTVCSRLRQGWEMGGFIQHVSFHEASRCMNGPWCSVHLLYRFVKTAFLVTSCIMNPSAYRNRSHRRSSCSLKKKSTQDDSLVPRSDCQKIVISGCVVRKTSPNVVHHRRRILRMITVNIYFVLWLMLWDRASDTSSCGHDRGVRHITTYLRSRPQGSTCLPTPCLPFPIPMAF